MIEFEHVSKVYDTGNKAVQDIDLNIGDGEFVFITGRSGAGKSTLLKLLTREIKASEGRVSVGGRDLGRLKIREIPRYRRSLGIIFQDFRLLSDRNVFENIAFAQRVIGASTGEIRKNVPEMMKLTGISSKYKNMPNQLSGGEQQRVAIARALINRPSVILADEPTGNLDEKNSEEILRLLLDINRMGTTVIVITHSRQLVESVDKRIIVMDKGRVTEDYIPVSQQRPISGFFTEERRNEGKSVHSSKARNELFLQDGKSRPGQEKEEAQKKRRSRGLKPFKNNDEYGQKSSYEEIYEDELPWDEGDSQ